jgi:hypothetical protein
MCIGYYNYNGVYIRLWGFNDFEGKIVSQKWTSSTDYKDKKKVVGIGDGQQLLRSFRTCQKKQN